MLLERLFEENQTYFQEMTMQVAAVEAKMTTLEQQPLSETQLSVERTLEEQLMSQEVNEEEYVERLKERKYDLLLSRQIALQCNAQIRMIQRYESYIGQSHSINCFSIYSSMDQPNVDCINAYSAAGQFSS